MFRLKELGWRFRVRPSTKGTIADKNLIGRGLGRHVGVWTRKRKNSNEPSLSIYSARNAAVVWSFRPDPEPVRCRLHGRVQADHDRSFAHWGSGSGLRAIRNANGSRCE